MDLEIVFPEAQPADKTAEHTVGTTTFLVGSCGGYDDGWLARIVLGEDVYLQLFPKYGLVAMELANNNNTNLPAGCSVEHLLEHLFKVSPNGKTVRPEFNDERGSRRFSADRVRRAIRKLKVVANEMHEGWGLIHRERETN